MLVTAGYSDFVGEGELIWYFFTAFSSLIEKSCPSFFKKKNPQIGALLPIYLPIFVKELVAYATSSFSV